MKKKLFSAALLATIAMTTVPLTAEAQSPESQKIVNALQGAGEPCRTANGENGRMYPTSKTVTHSTAQTKGQSNNSGSTSRTKTGGAEISTRSVGLSGNISTTNNSGSTTKNSESTQETTTTLHYECVPYGK